MAITDNLISYWPLDETSGTRVDSVTATGNDLTDNATVGYESHFSGNAAAFVTANAEFLERADNDSLSVAVSDNGGFTISFWIKSSGEGGVIAKDNTDAGEREFALFLSGGVLYGSTYDSSSGTSDCWASVDSNWHHIVFWYDSTAKTAHVVVDAGSDSNPGSALTNGIANSAARFTIGALGNTVTSQQFFTGSIDEVGFWKRVLTSDERTWLYNSGVGRTYAEIGGATGQVARPASDISDGGWLNELGTNTNLFESINEASASDTDWIQSAAAPVNDTCTVGLSTILTPDAGTVTMRIRAKLV